MKQIRGTVKFFKPPQVVGAISKQLVGVLVSPKGQQKGDILCLPCYLRHIDQYQRSAEQEPLFTGDVLQETTCADCEQWVLDRKDLPLNTEVDKIIVAGCTLGVKTHYDYKFVEIKDER